ncbi:MAG: AAA family ATPase, partial [Actinomycetota bacterium]|nr:AAA family ATPase [Actinomycetota bacterium]
MTLKGLSAPISACEVAWEPLPVSSLPLPALLTEVSRIFIGRDDELGRLGQLWKEASAGQRRVAFIAGEPGVGKTRLAAELAERVHDEGAAVLAGHCDEGLGVPYQPFVEALHHFVEDAPHLSTRLGRYGGELARLIPELRERVPDLPAPLRSDPETERYRLFDAVAAWLGAASVEEPLLLVLDDLQWAAKPTLLLLRHVVRAPDVKRVFVLGTYQDTELTDDHPLVEIVADLRRQGSVERFSLSGLDGMGVAALVEHAAGRTLQKEGLALARAIYQETAGNPFFVREVLRHLVETGAVEKQEGGWAARLRVEEMGITEGIRDVVGRRLSRLAEDTNKVLRVAAVAGTEFELPVVRAAGSFDEERLLSALEEAAGARLVIEASATRYRFSHALVRAALYEGMTAARRVVLHRRVAEAIETCHQGTLDDYLPALAHHWAKASAPAGATPRAVDYAARAGERALTQLAYDEAIQYYRQALELLVVAHGSVDEVRRLELLIALGDAQRRAADPGHRQTLLGAARLAQTRRDPESLARAALATNRGAFSVSARVDGEIVSVLEDALDAISRADSPLRARLMVNLAAELSFTPRQNHHHQLANEALAMARRLGDPATLGHVLNLAWTIFPMTDPAKLQHDA